MTAHAMAGDRERCLAAGMDGYLSKPINPQMLYAALEHQTASPPVPAPVPAPAAAPPVAQKSSIAAVDRTGVMNRLGGDEDLFGEVIDLFLEDCPARLTAIRQAVDRRDGEAIRIAAHALKGAAGNLSAAGLFEAAYILERLGAEGRLDAAEGAWRQLSAHAAAVMDALRQMKPSHEEHAVGVPS
jgi:HPt (histidine-containing phosphotransfer) domain-containing protein